MKLVRVFAISLCMVMAGVLAGCNQESPVVSFEEADITATKTYEPTYIDPRCYDSSDTAVIKAFSDVNNTISLYNYELGRSYTLNIDGITSIYDKYNNAMTLNQLSEGMIVDVDFLKSTKHLVNIRISSTAFIYDSISGFKADTASKTFTFDDESYRFSDRTLMLSKGEETSFDEIIETDTVTIRGIDTTIMSITVDTGHGYVMIGGNDYFVDGFVEIDDSKVYKLESEMRLVLPEGIHNIRISKNGNVYEESIEVIENTTSNIDLSQASVNENKFGKVRFTVEPKEANVKVDGAPVDTDSLVTLGVGMHKLVAYLDEYDTVTRYFNVIAATVEMKLELNPIVKDEEKEDVFEEGKSENDNDDESTDAGEASGESESQSEDKSDGEEEPKQYVVSFSAPEGANIFINGYFKGIVPLTIPKKTGTYDITVYMDGYSAKTYSIYVDDKEEDSEFSFDMLEELSENKKE